MSEQSQGSNTPAQIRLPLLLAIAVAAGMFIGRQLPQSDRLMSAKNADSPSGLAPTIEEILRYVESRYVDTLDFPTFKKSAIEHLLAQLDPHSVYIAPDEVQAVDDDMSGDFEGIGVEFLMLDDTLEVVTPLPGGPSEAAGILAGDKIVTINDTTVAGVKVDNGTIYRKLRGKKGSSVRLGIKRGRETALRQITVVRDVIPIKSVETAYMLDDQTGYIKVTRFSEKTHEEFMTALKPLCEDQRMTNLVLDLRGNPGGYLEKAIDMLSQFFPEGKLLLYTEGRADGRKEYESNGHARFIIQNLAVLIDEGSASASEIVAGAVQDYDRGWLIGRRTYGKGLVQEPYPLSDGGVLRLTVARYFTPSGRCIQRDYSSGQAEYEAETGRRLHNGELSDASKIKNGDTTRYYTGMGRIVFGGGGITPDVFIPLDTSYANTWFSGVNQQLRAFTSRWLDQGGKSSLPAKPEDFIAQFQVADDLLAQCVKFAEEHGVKNDEKAFQSAKNEIKLRLKAQIAHVMYGNEAMYRILNGADPAVSKALSLIQSGTPLSKK